ncbi:MAG TPA: hypothetical protein VLK79_15600 [Gaiellales bacterium]|nr:hypothetical protein [Gaiellales bacterium]
MGEDEARKLAQHHLAVTLPQRWLHVQAVAAEATRLCDAIGIDTSLTVSAVWLHDLGYAPAVRDTGFHPLDGARYLRDHGWDVQVCALVARHTYAALQAEMLGLVEQLNAEFADNDGIEQDVLWTADATAGPNGERLTLQERIAEITNRYDADSVVTRSMIASEPALAAAIARTQARLAERTH